MSNTQYTLIPSHKVLQADFEAAEAVLDVIKGNIAIAVQNGDARAALVYGGVLANISNALDYIQTAVDLLESTGTLADQIEAHVGLTRGGEN